MPSYDPECWVRPGWACSSRVSGGFFSRAVPRCVLVHGPSFPDAVVDCLGCQFVWRSFGCAGAFPVTSVLPCAGRKKRAPTRSRQCYCLLVLAGAARSRLCLVLVPARLLYWCRFAPAPVLHWYGVFASLMGGAVAPRPWFKFFGSQLRHERCRLAVPACRHFGPTANKRICAVCKQSART